MKKTLQVILLLGLTLLFSLSGAAASESAEVVETGECDWYGNVSYEIERVKIATSASTFRYSYTLRISGEGTIDYATWGKPEYRTGINHIYIGEGITEIAEGVFAGLSGAGDIVLPDSLLVIGANAFSGIDTLSTIDLKNVTTLGARAFADTSLQSITGEHLRTLEGNVFENCGFTSFTVPAGVTKINGSDFSGCAMLTEFRCAAGQSAYTAQDGVLYSADGRRLVAVPAQYAGAFTVPSVVEEIDSAAFSGNFFITSVTVPTSVQRIGTRAFEKMLNLTTVSISAPMIPTQCFSGSARLKEVTLGDGVSTIESKAFDGCSSLTFPVIPDSVLRIAGNAFSYDIAAKLPEQFQSIGGNYVVMRKVTVSLSERYDYAEELYREISALTVVKNRLVIDAELCEYAMLRAAENAVYYDATHQKVVIRPDGSATKSIDNGGVNEYLYSGQIEPKALAKALNQVNFAAADLKKTSYLGIGIGCIETGSSYYWVVVIRKEKGDGKLPKTGSVKRDVPVSYAGYLLPDATIFNKIPSFVSVGERILPRVFFGVDGGRYCELSTEGFRYSTDNSAVAARDDAGQILAVGEGSAIITAMLGGQSCPVSVYVNGAGTQLANSGITTHSCTIGESFGLNYYVKSALCEAYDSSYLLVEKPVYDGETVVRTEKTVVGSFDQTTIDGTSYRIYRYDGIAAKEMSVTISARLCGVRNGLQEQYQADSYSIRAYALEMLSGAGTSAELKRVLVDMLQYGSEAQNYFSYYIKNTAGSGLSAAQLALGTTTAAEASETSYREEAASEAKAQVYGTSLRLESSPSLCFYVAIADRPVYESAVLTDGKGQVIELSTEYWEEIGNGQYRVCFDGISQLRCRDSFTFYIKKNGAVISNRVTTGVEGYAYLSGRSGKETERNLAGKLLNMCDSLLSFQANAR